MQPFVKYSFRRPDKNQKPLFPTLKGKSMKKIPHKKHQGPNLDLSSKPIRDEQQLYKRASRFKQYFFERKRKDKYITIQEESSIEERFDKQFKSIDKQHNDNRSPSRIILSYDQTHSKEIKSNSFNKGKNSRKNLNPSKPKEKTLKKIQSQITSLPKIRLVISNKSPAKKEERYSISEEVVQKFQKKEQTVRNITTQQQNSIIALLKGQRKKKREKTQPKGKEEEDFNLQGWKLSEIKQNQFE